jgi:hypothetical protein
MELLNFSLYGDGIALEWQGQHLDLHNNFDFQSLHYNIRSQQVELTWRRSAEQWARAVQLPGLQLVFRQVSFLTVKERDPVYPFTDDNCLAHLSFHRPEERDEFDSISLTTLLGDDLTFYFQSEWGLKVNAETAELLPYASNRYNS